MLTVLTIKDERKKGIIKRISSLFSPYEIHTRIRSAAGIKLREIIYFRKAGKINWKAVAKAAGSNCSVLCENSIQLIGANLRKTKSNALGVAWCETFVCSVLDIILRKNMKPSISFYDPYAEYPAFAEKLTKYTDTITVITDMPRFYENIAERISEKTGAVMKVTNDTDRILPCDMLIIPKRLRDNLHSTALTPVFTSYPPCVGLSGTIIDTYHAKLPEKYRPLCPESIDEEEMMAALFQYEGADELRSIIPEYAHCAGKPINAGQAAELVIRRMTPPLSLCD